MAFTELWHRDDLRRPAWSSPIAELFPWSVLSGDVDVLFFVEGVLEVLVLESFGIPAVAATGDGLSFRVRDWSSPLRRAQRLVIAMRKGDSKRRRPHYPSRSDVIKSILTHVPGSEVLEWPEEVGTGQGVTDYLTRTSWPKITDLLRLLEPRDE